MTADIGKYRKIGRHGAAYGIVLCLFVLCSTLGANAQQRRGSAASDDERVYLLHSDELLYDQYGNNPNAQIVRGHVAFSHKGARLTCDSAYFYQAINSVKAYGHVHFTQGDTLSLRSDRADYDGEEQMMRARNHVVLTHKGRVLNTDSLDFDRLYGNAYFFEGGTLTDKNDKLVADWGQYNTSTREAVFYYNVKLRSGKNTVTTDTLHYFTRESLAHAVGPTVITSDTTIVNTTDAWLESDSDLARLFGRSTIVDGKKTIVGDTLLHNNTTGENMASGNVVYTDEENKNALTCDYAEYNEKTGFGYATGRALLRDYSQGDTLYMHSDTMKIVTYNIETDSVRREVHAYSKVKVYRNDVQAVCDSLVFTSVDSCLTMYRDPIVWSDNRQLLGEKIKVYMNDSTVREAYVIGQALSIEKIEGENQYNQVASREMQAFFIDGKVRRALSIGNVRIIFYPVDEKDSSYVGLANGQTDTMLIYISEERKMQKVVMKPNPEGVLYPMTQIPPEQYYLREFAWFEELRPTDKNDVFVWRGKKEDEKLKKIERTAAPLQRLDD